jgi:flap endonuclease-1
MIKKKLKPIFIFDGKASHLKQNVLDNRKTVKTTANQDIKDVLKKLKKVQDKLEPIPETKEEIEEQLKNITEAKILEETLIKLKKRTVSITFKQMEECKEILKLLGIPIIQAAEEADSQCASLVKKGFADYVASEDMDILTFGTNKLIRKLSAKDNVVEYDLKVLLKELGLSQEQFIDLCILLGCDYTPTIDKVGPKRAYELIKEYKSIDNIITSKDFLSKYTLPDNFNYKEAREYFINPPVNEIKKEELVWSIPKYDELKELLKTKYEYSDQNINKLFGVLQGGYYSVISGEKSMSQYNKDKIAYIKKLKQNISFESESD